MDSVQFSHSVVSSSLRPHEPQHTRPPCPSPTPGVHPNPCPLSWWCHPTISYSVVLFSSCPQSFPASDSFQMSQLFTSGGQNIRISDSTSVLPMNTQDWSPSTPLVILGSSRIVKAMVYPVVMYTCKSWTIKKAEHWRIDTFELWCWRRFLRVPWTARKSNQSIIKEISPGCSLEGLMLNLKF